METRSIGSLSVTLVGLGCNNFARKIDQKQSTDVVNAALEAGITHFDTADRYGYGDHSFSGEGHSELFLGRALGSRRRQVTVASKFGIPLDSDPLLHRGGSRRWVTQSCEGSLRRLGTDYIDLYQIHAPDPETPLEETLGALNDLVVAGKVREIGCSGYSGEELADAIQVANENGFARFVSAMHDYSLLVREPEKELIPACERLGVAFLPYFPLASGLLTGKYVQGEPAPEGSRLQFWTPRPTFTLSDENFDRISAFTDFATARGHTIIELAMSWLASRPGIATVVAGATTPDQVRENASAADWKLTTEDLDEVAKL